MARISSVMLRISLPAISGAAIRHQRLKCARYSVVVIPPLPTSSMSGSFQWPGPEANSMPSCKSRICTTPWPPHFISTSHLSCMSPVDRQRLPTSLAHSHGLVDPHSQMLKTIGRPDFASASRMSEYDAMESCDEWLHQSYLR